MKLFDARLNGNWRWSRVGDAYKVTRKPSGLHRSSFSEIPFAAMEAIPQDGTFQPAFTMKPPSKIASGTYFEAGDVLVAKITPSFENGKQALVRELSAPFGYATTEVIPLHPVSENHEPRFLFFYLLHPEIRELVAERMEGSTGRQRVPEAVLLDVPIPLLPHREQSSIADALELIQHASRIESKSEQSAALMKTSAMRTLFARGLRGEAQKETEVGLVPESWNVTRLDQCARCISTRMSYSELEQLPVIAGQDTVTVLGIKVGEMNEPGNEVELRVAGVTKPIARAIAEKQCAPPRTIVFPKRGAAIATNKKRITLEWTVFDPNVIGVIAKSGVEQSFLFQWFQMFDLRTITEPGPTPQLNKKHLDPLMIPLPPTLDEQREIVGVLDVIDQKIDLHRRKRAILDDLFKALLHKLMTGEIRVADLDLSALTATTVTQPAA